MCVAMAVHISVAGTSMFWGAPDPEISAFRFPLSAFVSRQILRIKTGAAALESPSFEELMAARQKALSEEAGPGARRQVEPTFGQIRSCDRKVGE